ncbi:MAG: hypothetical protein ACFB02_06875 [Mastigocoleus sp.]
MERPISPITLARYRRYVERARETAYTSLQRRLHTVQEAMLTVSDKYLTGHHIR